MKSQQLLKRQPKIIKFNLYGLSIMLIKCVTVSNDLYLIEYYAQYITVKLTVLFNLNIRSQTVVIKGENQLKFI